MRRTIPILAPALCAAILVGTHQRAIAESDEQAADRASTPASTQGVEKAVETSKDPAEPVYSVVSPLGAPTVEMIEMAPRLDTLAGKTIALVWNHTFKSNITLPAIGEALKKKYPDIKIIPYARVDAAIRAAVSRRTRRPCGPP